MEGALPGGVPQNVRCAGCDLALLGLVITGESPSPIGRDDCPRCGGAEFRAVRPACRE